MLPVLQYLKSKGVIHRDIKLENILYKCGGNCTMEYTGENSKFFLLDFGLVKDLTLGCAHSRYYVTVFMAPEMRDPLIGRQGHRVDC